MEADVLVEIAGITERTQAELALEGLETGMSAYMNLQSILSRVDLAAVDAEMSLLRGAHVTDNRLNLCGRIHWMRRERRSHRYRRQVGECGRRRW